MAHAQKTWKKCRVEYETIGTPIVNLAKKYKIGVNTIKVRIKRDSWIKLKVEKLAKVEAEGWRGIIDLDKNIEEIKGKVVDYKEEYKEELTDIMKHEQLKAQIALANDMNKLNIVNKSKVSIQQINEYEEEALESLKTASQITKSIDPPAVQQQQTNNTQINIYSNMDMQELQRELSELRSRVV